MVKTVVCVGLPIDEKLFIQKNRLAPESVTGKEKRITIVTGTHGDELDGQYVCYQLINKINQNQGKLKGIVDVYPALNPLGIDSVSRGIPMFELDMNRIFPGSRDAAMTENVAADIIEDIMGSDLCVDIHSSNVFLKETLQVRISNENEKKLLPYAKLLNTNLIWIHESVTVLEATLGHSLNSMRVPTLVVEMGVGMRITKEYGDHLVDGIFRLMVELGIWEEESIPIKAPIIATKDEVKVIHAQHAGVFVKEIEHNDWIREGEIIGNIINGLTGEIEEVITAPSDGIVFTLREYPIVYTGSLIARIVGGATK
ncbi:M14 family metallopeptidase [Candidatus Galacturonibacter soehngenii]|uniref:Succinylglutamate desuccinylase n=1 Tax=Candidatus Galacturonatibacter soehngenii TaxID=2307010 RepID=A0A7V7QNF6_9FIRM|nr:M14 family metallopeptidase [Candidatus Galacturonibacter soehngenii]KAB1440479.1 succinylglutamate desuccinylase [Candidatus Galacturonibacter soehngenii]MBA4688108.1 succinylglutamate desuccinylase/aspartoacylase family protein [Candidatus Galacturonibacter soehngenii]